MNDSFDAIQAIRTIAEQLGELREQMVFVGGAVRGLLVTDQAVWKGREPRGMWML